MWRPKVEDNDAGRETNRSICASRFTILSHPDITEKVVIVETQSKTKATRLLGSMIVPEDSIYRFLKLWVTLAVLPNVSKGDDNEWN